MQLYLLVIDDLLKIRNWKAQWYLLGST